LGIEFEMEMKKISNKNTLKNILSKKKKKIYGWVGVHMAPLVFLTGYRRWPPQVPYPQ
jgi:hypothetical protein